MGLRPALGMARMPIRQGGAAALCVAMFAMLNVAQACGLSDLVNQKDLTPESLARTFADFSFELAPQVQEPDAFLQRKRGDCADFSNLASTVLTQHGYTTKMVVVMMAHQTHVVCYVKEAGGFLDYNHRADVHPVIPSDGSLEDIAGKVAGDFHTPWRMASFFRYRKGYLPVYLDSVFAGMSLTPKPVVKAAKTTAPAEAMAVPLVSQSAIN